MPTHNQTVACGRWVFEEYVKEEDGKWMRPSRGAKPPEGKTWVDEGYSPLTEVINTKNENVCSNVYHQSHFMLERSSRFRECSPRREPGR